MNKFFWIGFYVLSGCLVFGEIYNGFYKASGFHLPLFLVGLAAVAAIYLVKLRLVPTERWKERLGGLVSSVQTYLRDEPPAAQPRTVAHLAVLSVVLACVYLLLLVMIYTYVDPAACPRHYLDAIRDTASRLSFADVLLLETCVDRKVFNPVSFVLLGWLGDSPEAEAVAGFFKFNVVVVVAVIAINSLLYIKRLRLSYIILSNFCLLLVLIGGERIVGDDFIETAFMLLFFVNFLLILHHKRRVWYLLLTGLVTGLVLSVKEVNFINLALALLLLSLSPAEVRRRLKHLLLFLAGLAVGVIPALAYLVSCGQTEGLSHASYLYFRGWELMSLSQEVVYDMFSRGFSVSVLDVILNRLTFQTVGELLVGGTVALLPWCLTVFPVPYLLANCSRERARTFLLFLLLAMGFYGLSFWKGGDSANPVYTTMAFGYVFCGPFLIRLVRAIATAVKQRRLFTGPGVSLLLMAGINVAAFTHWTVVLVRLVVLKSSDPVCS